MKNFILILALILIMPSIFALDSSLELSSQSISINQYSESSYNLNVSSVPIFSTGFDIISETDDVTISVNGNDYNTDSLYLNDLSEGTYLIQVRKNGYKSIKRWINLDEDTRLVIEITLERKFGYINIESNQQNLEYYIDDISIENNQPIPTGNYILLIRGFGFEEETHYINIYSNRTTTLEVELDKAPFRLENINSDKSIYNPNAYDGFGTNKIKIDVNGPGEGNLFIKDEYGNIIVTQALNFTSWSTFYEINDYLEDGIYTIIIESEEMSKSNYFEVDNNLFIHNIPIFRGFPGLVVVPTAENNPVTISNTSTGIGASLNNLGIEIPFIFQMNIEEVFSFRAGLDFSVDFENDSHGLDVFTGVKLAYNFYNLLYAFNFNYQFINLEYKNKDSILQHNLIFNTPLSININNLYFTVTPEYLYNITDKNYTLGLGSGIHFDNQKIRYGLSGRVDNTEGNLEYLFGGEFHYLLPKTQSYAGITLTSNEDADISLKLLFSVLY